MNLYPMIRTLIFIPVLCATLVSAQPAGSQTIENPCNPKTLSVLWQQTSAEYRALCYQAFNLATLRIDQIPEKTLKTGHLAIITDLDETILDNSPGEAQSILEHRSHTAKGWKEWVKLKAAPALPGAVEFLNYAHSKGISVFYISNRETDEVAWTLENLKALDLPDADTAHMLFMNTTSSKETRRQAVLKNYQVVMLLGDNLNDFTTLFEKRSIRERNAEADKVREEWGRKFIVLPNSTYGEWENAIYNYNRHLTADQKDSIRLSTLNGYRLPVAH